MVSVGDEVNHKRRLGSLLLIPCLVFSNVVIALNWEDLETACFSYGDHITPGSITLDGAEYDLYTFGYDDLDSGNSFSAGGGECELSDWYIRAADEIDLIVRTSGYTAYDACSLEGDNECDDAVVQETTTWIPMERCTNHCVTRSARGPVNGYFAFDDGGWFGDGSFMLAVEPGIKLNNFQVSVGLYDDILSPLIFSIFLTPAALWFVNRWAKTNHQPHLRPSAVVFGKNVLKVAVVHGFSLICIALVGGPLSYVAPFVFASIVLLTPSFLVYAERKRYLSSVFASAFVFLLVPIQVVLLFLAGRGGPLGCHAFLTAPEVNPLDTHPSIVYYVWLCSHIPLLWHYLTARRLQHPYFYAIAIPVLFVFLIDMSISHTAMLAGVGGSIDGCSEYQSASIRYTIGTVSLLLLAGSMTWARRYHKDRLQDSGFDDEENVANGPLMSGETLHQAKAIDIELGADEMSSAPNGTDNNPEPKCQDEV